MPIVNLNALTLTASVQNLSVIPIALDVLTLVSSVLECSPGVTICILNVDSHDFGEVAVSSQEDWTLRITNDGVGTLSGTISISSGSDHFSVVGSASYSLGSGQYEDFVIRFAPQEPGIFSGTIETGNALCQDVSLSGSSSYPMTTAYFSHGESENEVIVYLPMAVIVPYPIEHEPAETIARTENRALKVYSHSLGGSKKRIFYVTAYMKNRDIEGYRWLDLESFFWETVQGAKEQFTFGDNFDQTYIVRMIKFGPPQYETRDLVKIRMLLEEDYSNE